MSALNSFVAKVTNVQNDISKSFKNWSNRTRIVQKGACLENVNLDAGADILQKYQDNWAKISKASVDNAKKAQVIDDDIKKIFISIKEQHDTMKTLNSLLEGLPHISNSLNITLEKIDFLGETLHTVEKMLINLENIAEVEEIHNNKLYHEQQLAIYKTKKNDEVEHIKIAQSQKHAVKLSVYERQMQALVQEKQKAFDEMFKDDMKSYENTGHVIVRSVSNDSHVDISEISINEDYDALEAFLKIESCSRSDSEYTGYDDSKSDSLTDNSSKSNINNNVSADDSENNIINQGLSTNISPKIDIHTDVSSDNLTTTSVPYDDSVNCDMNSVVSADISDINPSNTVSTDESLNEDIANSTSTDNSGINAITHEKPDFLENSDILSSEVERTLFQENCVIENTLQAAPCEISNKENVFELDSSLPDTT